MTVQPTLVTPILKDGSKNRPLYSKYSLDFQLVHVRNTHRPKHTQCTCALNLTLASHSFVLLRIENNNNKSAITLKRWFDICFLCLSALWLVSHLIYAVQEEGQRSRLLFLQVTVAQG